jgi:hypothetical protein
MDEPYEFTTDKPAWCWNQTAPNSLLRKFILDTLAQHWTYSASFSSNKKEWTEIFKTCPELREALLFALAGLAEQCAENSANRSNHIWKD